MTNEDRDRLIELKLEQDILQDALGKIINIVSEKIISNQMEIVRIKNNNKK